MEKNKRIRILLYKESKDILDHIKHETDMTFTQIINQLISLSEIIDEEEKEEA